MNMDKMDKIEKVRQEIERLKGKLIRGACAAQIEMETNCKDEAYNKVLAFLDTLSEEPDRPEPYTGKYDEAYLNEKIKKATESWKGVDVDAMLAECRGYDEEKSEEPDKDLEEEVKNYFQGYWPGTETAEQCNTDLHFTPLAILRLARHFSQWGAEHVKIDVTNFCKPIDPGIAQCIADHSWEMLGEEEKPEPNDLEEAAEKFARFYDNGTCDGIAQDCFIAGAKWQAEKDKDTIELAEDHAYLAGAVNEREQMMKGAVEGIAHPYDSKIWVNLLGYGYKFNDGDKVRIIVLKAEEE